jgi:hypothetical protein
VDHKDNKETGEIKVILAYLEHQEQQVNLDKMEKRDQLDRLVHPDLLVPLVLQDQQDQQDPGVLMALALKGTGEILVYLAQKGSKVQLDQLVQLAHPARLVHLASLEKEDSLVPMVRKVTKVKQAIQEALVHLDQLEPRENEVLLGLPDHLDHKD